CLPIIFGGCAPIILGYLHLKYPHPNQTDTAAHPLADKYVTVWSKSALTLEPAVSPAQQSFSEDDRAHALNAVTGILRSRFPQMAVVESPAAVSSGPYKTILVLDLSRDRQVVALCLNVFVDRIKVSELCSYWPGARTEALDRVVSDLHGKAFQYLKVPL